MFDPPPLITDRDALAFLWQRINYERQPVAPYGEQHFKLARMQTLLDRLGNPERSLPLVHLAGTKGKGSTAAFIAAMLTASGRRVGVYSSPHLHRVEERLAIDGRPCPPAIFADLVRQVAPVALALDRETAAQHPDETGPTYFELLTAMAFLYFAQAGAEAAVIEVGLGGRLDSTNVCQPRVTAITSISFDHTQQLGNTLAEIAREKAGIAKPGVPLISGVRQDEPAGVIRRTCAQVGAPLREVGSDYTHRYFPAGPHDDPCLGGELDFATGCGADRWELSRARLGMLGRHQADNAAVALAVMAELRRQGWTLDDQACRGGLLRARVPARVEVISRDPVVVLDSAHNVASIEALVETLAERFPLRPRWLVFGTTQDKDVDGMLRALLPAFPRICFTRYLHNPRSVPADELLARARQCETPGPERERLVAVDPGAAWGWVQAGVRPGELAVITGSFFLAHELGALLQTAVASAPAAGERWRG